MNRNIPRRNGFTLIEVLVTLILLAILAAAVFPVVVQQSENGDPVRAAQDLSTIRSGIEQFQLDVRPSFPGDIEDLLFRMSTAVDASISSGTFSATQATKWNGPYIDMPLTESGVSDTTSTATASIATETGFGGIIRKDLNCFNATTNIDSGTTCSPSTSFVAVKVTGLSDAQFRAINELIDGTTELTPGGEDTGKLRFGDLDTDNVLDTNENVYYLAAPFRGN